MIERVFRSGMAIQGAIRLCSDPAASRLYEAVDELDEAIKDVRNAVDSLSGSSSHVIQRARCPVVIVHPEDAPHPPLDGAGMWRPVPVPSGADGCRGVGRRRANPSRARTSTAPLPACAGAG